MLEVQIAFKAQNIAEYCRIPNQSNEGQSRKIMICQINAAVAFIGTEVIHFCHINATVIFEHNITKVM